MAAPALPPLDLAAATTDAALADRYRQVRQFSHHLASPLRIEDYVVQSMEDVSPTKWHLAHTSWFFETFILQEHLPGYEPIDERYAYLFNSYYVQAGPRHCRAQRGYISRPGVEEVYAFREYVDRHMQRLLSEADDALMAELKPLVEIGMHHEQQHQELLLTDIKHVLSVNPLRPTYRDDVPLPKATGDPTMGWVTFDEGLYEIGHEGDGFHYDNEGPRHRHYLRPYALADRLVTCGEYLQFIEEGGYKQAPLWLSAGFATAQEQDWQAPFYWEEVDGQWHVYTLGGLRPLREDEPVAHLSYFEADAFARWAGYRLPTEFEWEVAARRQPTRGNLVERASWHPTPVQAEDRGPLRQLYGDVWEWTRSQYEPYPGYEPLPGALGEYNGKFMCNQFVLRGGSVATSETHIRPTYRNFFPPDATWQFTGLRLAQDV